MSAGIVARSRASERINRVSTNLDRASGYVLGNISATPTSATLRRARDSSLGTMGRSNYDAPTTSIRFRDSSINRAGKADTYRQSTMMIPTNTETAKYNRQMAIEEIHSSFMKTYKETNSKLHDRAKDEEGERRSKAYQKIISNAPPTYMDEVEAKRKCVSEMFMDTSKFSTKTLSAINGLEGAVIRKKQEYNWRKEMEEYEKRAEYERDVRARNVTALHRSAGEENSAPVNSRKRQPNTAIEATATEKAPKQEETGSTLKSWRERRAKAQAEAATAEPEPERKSWREKLAEKQKEEEERKAKAKAAKAAEAQESNNGSTEPAADASADASAAPAEEEEDVNGTKKMKSDFDLMMSNLDAEMEAGRSKLAKLRERIRRAKGAIKEADEALAEDDRKAAAARAAKAARAEAKN